MIKYIHILLLSLSTLGVVCGSFQLPSVLVSGQSTNEISDLEEIEYGLLFFLFENDLSEEQNDTEDTKDLDPQEEYNRSKEIGLDHRIPFMGLSDTQVKSNLIAQRTQVHPPKRYLLFNSFKIYC